MTWIFALLFLHVIASAQSGRRGLLYLLPVLMVLWTNLHGGFVAGILILGCYAMGEMLTGLFEINPESVRAAGIKAALTRSAPYWKSLALCAAATLVNPYGWQLHRHIFVYLSDSELLDKIQEFQSISFHAGMPAVLFEIMLALTAFVIFTKLRERQFAPVLLLCVWVHLALLSARHIPLFMLIAAPFVAELLTAVLAMAYHMPFVSGLARTLGGISNDFRSMELTPRLHLISAAALLALVGFFAAGQAPFAPQFNADDFPVQAIPVLQRHVGSRVFTTDQWADYLLYRMYPAQRVFFDGRSDFYGNDFVKLNQRLIAAEHDWKTLLQRFAIGLVVLKPETPLSAVLKLTPGSNVLFDDGKVIVFDTSGISQQPLGQGYIANRAVSVVPPTQPGTRPGLLPRFGHIAVSASHSNNSKKGKTS